MQILLMLLQADAHVEPARAISPPSGDLSPLAWVIVCALSTAILALGRFCMTLYGDLKKAREDLAEAYEDQAQLLKALRLGLDVTKNPPTSVPPLVPPPPANPAAPGDGAPSR